ncbi:MAG TPA: hypothetical protein VH352_17685 [Pseudonocardiaceae bacterium]|nr:hypothetical protein [Pseudonocardiaceae bacterium]
MTEWEATVTGSGPTHAGFGNQFNGPTFYITDGGRLLRGGRDPRLTAKDHLVRLNRQFVEPPGYGQALSLLSDYGCCVLIGEPGVGMRAAGQVLLSRLGGSDAVIQDESGIPDTSRDPILDADQVTEGDLILLDPSDAEHEDLVRIMQRLPSYQAELRKRGAHLVVVLDTERDYLVRTELRPLMAHIRRPSGLDVVRRHLQVADIPCTDEQLRSAGLRSRLNTDPIGELAELVRLIGAARKRVGDAMGFDRWLADALDALDELGTKVAAHVREHCAGPQRALLLATAMLAGAPPDQVQFAAAGLAAATAQPDDERPALERDDLALRLTELKIVVDPAGHTRFAALGYAGAVRRHFWDNFPELRPSFRQWARQAAVSVEVGAQYRSEFVTHFADQVLRTNRPDDIVTLVEAWIKPGSDRGRSLPAAAVALEAGLGHRRHGARFRRLVYDWATRLPRLDAGAAHLAVALSADVIASTHPSQALVRLHHFVRRQTDDVRAAAEEALLRLVHRNRQEFRLLVERVVTGMTNAGWAADFELFRTVAHPDELAPPHGVALIGDEAIRAQLVKGWRAVLFERPSVFWGALAREWLNSVEHSRFAEFWLDVLARACAPPGIGSGRLYVVARDWTRELDVDRPARSRIALDLTNRMDQAQGITPAAGPRHRRSEEHI